MDTVRSECEKKLVIYYERYHWSISVNNDLGRRNAQTTDENSLPEEKYGRRNGGYKAQDKNWTIGKIWNRLVSYKWNTMKTYVGKR